MAMTRGFLLIAAFATTWGLLASLPIAIWRPTSDAPPGFAQLAGSVGIGFLATLLVFGLLDRTLLHRGNKQPRYQFPGRKETGLDQNRDMTSPTRDRWGTSTEFFVRLP